MPKIIKAPFRYGVFDYVKLILAFLVIAIHANPFGSFGGLTGGLNIYFSRVLSRLAVPLFFMISGFLFFSRYPENGSNREQSVYVLGYIKRILVLWFSWFLVLFPMSYYINIIRGSLSVADLLVNIFFRGGYTVAWYFMASIHGLLLVCLLKRLRNDAVLLLTSFVGFLFCLASSTYFDMFPESWARLMRGYITEVFDPCFSFPFAVVFMGVGAWFSTHVQFARRISRRVLGGVLLFSVAMLGVEAYQLKNIYDIARREVFDNNLYFSILPMSICIFAFMLRWDLQPNKTIRNLSTLVFLSHMVFVVVISRIVFYTIGRCNSLLQYLLVICCSLTFGLSLLAVEKRYRLRWLRHLY